MALINLSAKYLNADGSTTLFGAQGNAIENINDNGVTIYAAPDAVTSADGVPIWYAPANNTDYFQNILDNVQSFRTDAYTIDVFKLYDILLTAPDSTLQTFFSYLAANNIKLGIEAAALTAGPGQPGYGVEGFGGAGDLVKLVDHIKALGGTLSYVAWDEPWFYGSLETGIYTTDGVAAQVAASAAAVKAIFPDVQIGDIEPVGAPGEDTAALSTWFTAYDKAAGAPMAFFQADVTDWTAGWKTSLADTITAAHADAIPVQMIIDGLGVASTDTAWATQAVATAQIVESDPALRPDAVIVQSWTANPSEAPSPTTPGTLASVEADVASAMGTALAVPAVAQYDLTGALQQVTWSNGWTASHSGDELVFAAPSGSVVVHYAWNDVAVFGFDPQSATVSLTLRAAASTTLPGGTDTATVSVTTDGFVISAVDPAAKVPPGTLSLALAPASATGLAGSDFTNQAKPTVTGMARSNATVTLTVDGNIAGTVTANAVGVWSFTFASPLANGVHDVQAVATEAGTADQHVVAVISVDTTPPTAPTLTLAPGSDSFYPGDGMTDATAPVLTGTADAGVMLDIRIDGKLVDSTRADADGTWTYTPNAALVLGTHSVTATATNQAGTIASAAMQLVIETSENPVDSNVDPLFDAAWYLANHPDGAAANVDPYTEFMTTGWKLGYDPDPYFSTSYYLSQNPDVAAAGVNPLQHFEQYGWSEGRNPSALFNTHEYAAANPGIPSGEDPLVAFLQSQYYTDAIVTASATSGLQVALAHAGAASSAGAVTDDPVLAISAQPGATLTLTLTPATGAATTTSFTIGTSGSWSYAYAPATLADGAYTVTLVQTDATGATASTSTRFVLDRTSPVVTALAMAKPAGSLQAGDTATISLTLSEATYVTGTPTLALNDGGVATYESGSGTAVLIFRYNVAAGQTTSALAVTGVNLPGAATLRDAAGNDANLAGAVKTVPGSVVVVAAQQALVTPVSLGLTGSQLVVNHGDGPFIVTGSPTHAVVTLGKGNDSVKLGGFLNVVTLGNGNDSVTINGPLQTLHVGNGTEALTLNGNFDHVTLGDTPAGSTSVVAVNGSSETITGGDGAITVTGPTGRSVVTLGDGYHRVTLTGAHNTVTVGTGGGVITAGTNSAVVHAGGGNVTVNVAGQSNLVDIQSGGGVINAGASRLDTFMLNGVNQGLTIINGFSTSGDMLDLSRTLLGTTAAHNLSNIGRFITTETAGGNTTLLVDPTGSGGTPYAFAVLNNTTATLGQLVAGRQITL